MAIHNIEQQEQTTAITTQPVHTNAVAKPIPAYNNYSLDDDDAASPIARAATESDHLLLLPTATIVTDDDSSTTSDTTISEEEREPTPTIEEQLEQLPKRNTPQTNKSYQELVSQSQPSFDVAEKPVYEDLKRRRKRTQAVTATAAGAAGLVVLGPFGAVFGAVAGAAVTKAVAKSKERKIIKGYEKRTIHLNQIPARYGELV